MKKFFGFFSRSTPRQQHIAGSRKCTQERARAVRYAEQSCLIAAYEETGFDDHTQQPRCDDEDVLSDGEAAQLARHPSQASAEESVLALLSEPDAPHNLVLRAPGTFGPVYESADIRGASLPKLVELLTSGRLRDSDDFADFVLFARYHAVTAHELLDLLALRFAAPRAGGGATSSTTQPQSCVRFLLRWLRNHPEDFYGDPLLGAKAKQLLLDQLDPTTRLAQRLALLLEGAVSGHACMVRLEPSAAEQRYQREEGDVLPPAVVRRCDPARMAQEKATYSTQQPPLHLTDFLVSRPYDIAQQLTQIEWQLYRLVEPREVMGYYVLACAASRAFTPNVMRLVKHSTHIGDWFQKELLSHKNPVERALCAQKVIEVTDELLRLRNYSSAFCLVEMLNRVAVYHHRFMWDLLPPKTRERFKQQCSLAECARKGEKLLEQTARDPVPRIYPVGALINDSCIHQETEPAVLPMPEGAPAGAMPILNLEPLRRAYNIVRVMFDARKYGATCYNFWPVPEFQAALMTTQCMSEDEVNESCRRDLDQRKHTPPDQLAKLKADVPRMRAFIEKCCFAEGRDMKAARPSPSGYVEACGEWHSPNRVKMFVAVRTTQPAPEKQPPHENSVLLEQQAPLEQHKEPRIDEDREHAHAHTHAH